MRQNAGTGRPATQQEVKHSCTSQFQAPITRDEVSWFVLRDGEKVIQMKSAPQKEQCLQVRRVLLPRTVQDLNEYVRRCTAELIFNLGEVRISDSQDRETRKFIVPVTMRGSTKHHRISRNVNQSSEIACVSTVAKSLIPDIGYPVRLEHQADLATQLLCFGMICERKRHA
jgi:hypothetical protein